MNEDRPSVSLRLDSSPETLTLVRGALGGVAEALDLDPELLDDIKTAVSEACNNVVMHAYDGSSGPLWVGLYIGPETIEVVVQDQGSGISDLAQSDDRLQGVGIPIMRALAQETVFGARPGGGTEVRMRFTGRRGGEGLYRETELATPDDNWDRRLQGDAVVSLSPPVYVAGVLGRLARALAARARFSLDRFSDVYLVTDALASHALHASAVPRICFGVATQIRRLEVTIGPLQPGASEDLTSDSSSDVGSALRLLTDELEVRSENGSEALRVVMRDQRGPASSG